MFTGIIEELGTLREALPAGGGARLTIAATRVLEDIEPGASIAVNGCCLSVTGAGADWWTADAVPETLARTALGGLAAGARVNLERAVPAGGRLGGHLVQGHVDATTTVAAIAPQADGSHRYRFRLDPAWARYVCEKGSIAIDGVSLTVAGLGGDWLEIAVIPHTAAVTNLGLLAPGDAVNIEVDILAKYVERQLAGLPHSPQHGSEND